MYLYPNSQKGLFLIEILLVVALMLLLAPTISMTVRAMTKAVHLVKFETERTQELLFLHSTLVENIARSESVTVSNALLGLTINGNQLWFGVYKGRFFRQKAGSNRFYLSQEINFESSAFVIDNKLLTMTLHVKGAPSLSWSFYISGDVE